MDLSIIYFIHTQCIYDYVTDCIINSYIRYFIIEQCILVDTPVDHLLLVLQVECLHVTLMFSLFFTDPTLFSASHAITEL